MAALKQQKQAQTPYVTTVSCGDFVQGEVIGVLSRGESMVEIMNQVGYDYVIPGNHEFDFGMQHHHTLMDMLDAKVVCANLMDLQSGKPVHAPYDIARYGNVKVAFVGLATPATVTSVSPKTFLNSRGEKIYSFSEENFYETVQQSVDNARDEGAHYVIALSHLGDPPYGENPTSISLISNTKGIDAVLAAQRTAMEAHQRGHTHAVGGKAVAVTGNDRGGHWASSVVISA